MRRSTNARSCSDPILMEPVVKFVLPIKRRNVHQPPIGQGANQHPTRLFLHITGVSALVIEMLCRIASRVLLFGKVLPFCLSTGPVPLKSPCNQATARRRCRQCCLFEKECPLDCNIHTPIQADFDSAAIGPLPMHPSLTSTTLGLQSHSNCPKQVQLLGRHRNQGFTTRIAWRGASIMNSIILGRLGFYVILGILEFAGQASVAAAPRPSLYVTNDGADSGACGAQSNPCRSIVSTPVTPSFRA
jgi:hypothetical protein